MRTRHFTEQKASFLDLMGETFVSVRVEKEWSPKEWRCGADALIFEREDGVMFVMYHEPNPTSQNIYLRDIAGSLDLLIGERIVEARVDSHKAHVGEFAAESATWTFYNIGTRLGMVTISWYGESNGYYSEQVETTRMEPIYA